jgi:DNA-binding MarR family transcriptional regulator
VEPSPDLTTLLLRAHRGLAADLAASMAERGYGDVRAGHGAVFRYVDRRSGSRLGELAARAGMSKQSMMQVVDDLESRGYVVRVGDPADSRARLVRLTAEGRRCATEFGRVVRGLETRTRRRLGDRGHEALRDALAALAEGI